MTQAFKITETDKKDIYKKIRSFKRTLLFGPVFAILVSTLLLIRISYDQVSVTTLWLMGFVFLAPMLALSLLAPPKAIKRYKKLLVEIQISENGIQLVQVDNTIIFLKDYKLMSTEFIYGNKPIQAISINGAGTEAKNSILLTEFFPTELRKYLK